MAAIFSSDITRFDKRLSSHEEAHKQLDQWKTERNKAAFASMLLISNVQTAFMTKIAALLTYAETWSCQGDRLWATNAYNKAYSLRTFIPIASRDLLWNPVAEESTNEASIDVKAAHEATLGEMESEIQQMTQSYDDAMGLLDGIDQEYLGKLETAKDEWEGSLAVEAGTIARMFRAKIQGSSEPADKKADDKPKSASAAVVYPSEALLKPKVKVDEPVLPSAPAKKFAAPKRDSSDAVSAANLGPRGSISGAAPFASKPVDEDTFVTRLPSELLKDRDEAIKAMQTKKVLVLKDDDALKAMPDAIVQDRGGEPLPESASYPKRVDAKPEPKKTVAPSINVSGGAGSGAKKPAPKAEPKKPSGLAKAAMFEAGPDAIAQKARDEAFAKKKAERLAEAAKKASERPKAVFNPQDAEEARQRYMRDLLGGGVKFNKDQDQA